MDQDICVADSTHMAVPPHSEIFISLRGLIICEPRGILLKTHLFFISGLQGTEF